ncbi:serine/threonine protein kinase, partial [Escherichia coli]|nr:serine/threonine protein kinase [Escherichia coli]
MQLTLAMTNPAGRNPTLFLKDKATLEDILNSDKPDTKYNPLLADVTNKKANPAVLAREPDNFVDQKKNFYLLPVLESDEAFT